VTAPEDTGEQGDSLANGTLVLLHLPPGPGFGEPRLISLVPLPGNITHVVVANEDPTLLRRQSGTKPFDYAAFYIFDLNVPPSININPGINRMFQQTV